MIDYQHPLHKEASTLYEKAYESYNLPDIHRSAMRDAQRIQKVEGILKKLQESRQGIQTCTLNMDSSSDLPPGDRKYYSSIMGQNIKFIS